MLKQKAYTWRPVPSEKVFWASPGPRRSGERGHFTLKCFKCPLKHPRLYPSWFKVELNLVFLAWPGEAFSTKLNDDPLIMILMVLLACGLIWRGCCRFTRRPLSLCSGCPWRLHHDGVTEDLAVITLPSSLSLRRIRPIVFPVVNPGRTAQLWSGRDSWAAKCNNWAVSWPSGWPHVPEMWNGQNMI